MRPRDSDAIARWDARARTLLDRIDAALGEEPAVVAVIGRESRLGALVHRVIDRTPPPPGEVVYVVPAEPAMPNMGPQPDRIDAWDAFVCRFDGIDAEAAHPFP